MATWRRLVTAQSLKEHFLTEAKQLREQANLLPYGSVRDAALKKARQAETAARMEEWINSPGLRPPKDGGNPGPIDAN